MTVLAQLSDPHVDVGPGDTGSADALAAAVAAVGRLDPAPDAVLVSGDLTNRDDARSYERVRDLLAPLAMPVHVLPGNHDDREALRAWFGDDPARPPGAPFAMHHAPLLTGIGAMDAIGLPGADRAALGALLRRSPQVRRVVAGHVHRACFGLLGGYGVFACPSTHLQVRWDSGPEIVLEPAPPAYALHTVPASGEVVTLVQPVASGAG